jgi:lysophospholipase L1-like esterase
MHRIPLLNLSVAVCCAFVLSAGASALQPQGASPKWITAWATTQAGVGTTSVSNATVRMMTRITIPGDAVRIRIDNVFGTALLNVGKAYVGQRATINGAPDGGARLLPGTNKPVTFKGAATVAIPAGGSVVSDQVTMEVLAQQDLAVSLYIPDTDIKPSQHGGAVVTSYLSTNGRGDVANDDSGKPFTEKTTAMLWVKSVDVLSSSATGAIVAFGDSITDGTCTTLDAHNRWEDWLALRIAIEGEAAGVRSAVVNEGIGANTITREHLDPPPSNTPATERLERDVFSHTGVTHVFMFLGTNDINRGAQASQVIAGIQQIAKEVRAKGIRIVGTTIIARNAQPSQGRLPGWTVEKSKIKNEVDEFIRTKSPFDAMVDFDKVVRDPSNPDEIYEQFNCDGTHPSPRGAMRSAPCSRDEVQ